MEDHSKLIENLLEKATEYGKTTYELVKLKILDKTLQIVSSLITRFIVLIISMLFIVFSSAGLAFWLGEILGKTYYGFFATGAFYGLAAVIFYSFMRKGFKKFVNNYIIKHELK